MPQDSRRPVMILAIVMVLTAVVDMGDAARVPVYLTVYGDGPARGPPYSYYFAIGDLTQRLYGLPVCLAYVSSGYFALENVNTSVVISRGYDRHVFFLLYWDTILFPTLSPNLTGTYQCVTNTLFYSRHVYHLHVVVPPSLICDRSNLVLHGHWDNITTVCMVRGYPLPSIRWNMYGLSVASRSIISTDPVLADGLYSFNATLSYTTGHRTLPTFHRLYKVTAVAYYASNPCEPNAWWTRCEEVIRNSTRADFHGLILYNVPTPVTSPVPTPTPVTSLAPTSSAMPQNTEGAHAWVWVMAVVSAVMVVLAFTAIVVYKSRRNISQRYIVQHQAARKGSTDTEATIQEDVEPDKVPQAPVEGAVVVTSSD